MPWYLVAQLDLLLVQDNPCSGGRGTPCGSGRSGVDDRQRNSGQAAPPGQPDPVECSRWAVPRADRRRRCELRATGRSDSAKRRAPSRRSRGIRRCAVPSRRRQMCRSGATIVPPFAASSRSARRRRGGRASCGRTPRAPRPRGRPAPRQPGPPAPGLAQLRGATPGGPQDGARTDTIARRCRLSIWGSARIWVSARRPSASPRPPGRTRRDRRSARLAPARVDPVGYEDQPRFLNGVARLQTGSRLELLSVLRSRARPWPHAPRPAPPGGDHRPRRPPVRQPHRRRAGAPDPHPRMGERLFVWSRLPARPRPRGVPGRGQCGPSCDIRWLTPAARRPTPDLACLRRGC